MLDAMQRSRSRSPRTCNVAKRHCHPRLGPLPGCWFAGADNGDLAKDMLWLQRVWHSSRLGELYPDSQVRVDEASAIARLTFKSSTQSQIIVRALKHHGKPAAVYLIHSSFSEVQLWKKTHSSAMSIVSCIEYTMFKCSEVD